jgi:hypothetical protein
LLRGFPGAPYAHGQSRWLPRLEALPSLKLDDGSTLKLRMHGEKINKYHPEEVGKIEKDIPSLNGAFGGDMEGSIDKNSQLESSGVNSYFCESHGSGVSFLAALVPETAKPWGHRIRVEGTRPIP